ncbi:hypothetical protein EG68_10537 [Paragonimus skrjabini miyazakii]|uniref:Uncharacterized protein n=1 Tax=Paragonimus skrjabini miyazakii TaxID=59628 RepID=A0A8S9YB73_9TREM|nr:hypothetical protein EG68_10537 [Paragonimus skrjabini miyazakii]
MLEQLGLCEDDNWKTRRQPFRLLPAIFRARSHSVGLSVIRNAQKRLSLPLGHCTDDTCRLVRSFAKCEVSFSPDKRLSDANQVVASVASGPSTIAVTNTSMGLVSGPVVNSYSLSALPGQKMPPPSSCVPHCKVIADRLSSEPSFLTGPRRRRQYIRGGSGDYVNVLNLEDNTTLRDTLTTSSRTPSCCRAM